MAFNQPLPALELICLYKPSLIKKLSRLAPWRLINIAVCAFDNDKPMVGMNSNPIIYRILVCM